MNGQFRHSSLTTLFCLSGKEDEREDRITEISQLYQIFPDEVLGSGQFGTVYGGNGLVSLVMKFLCTNFYLFKPYLEKVCGQCYYIPRPESPSVISGVEHDKTSWLLPLLPNLICRGNEHSRPPLLRSSYHAFFTLPKHTLMMQGSHRNPNQPLLRIN